MPLSPVLRSPLQPVLVSPLGDDVDNTNYIDTDLTNWNVTAGGALTGSSGVYTFTDDSSGGSAFLQIQATATIVPAGAMKFYAEFRRAGLTMGILRTQLYDASANGISIFDLAGSGVLVDDANHTTTIEALGSNWYGASITFTTTSDLNGLPTIMMSQNGTNGQVDKDGTSSIKIRNVSLKVA